MGERLPNLYASFIAYTCMRVLSIPSDGDAMLSTGREIMYIRLNYKKKLENPSVELKRVKQSEVFELISSRF